MGVSKFYWYPRAGGSLETTSLGERITDIQEEEVAVVADAGNAYGQMYRVHQGSTLRVRIVCERFGPVGASATERALVSLQAHLMRGGLVGFATDHDKAWAGCASTAARGASTVHSDGSGFAGWEADATLEVGDEVVIESAWPEAQREVATVGLVVADPPVSVLVASPGLVYGYDGAVIVRHRDFYPALRLPQDQVGRRIVTHDHRLNFTLDVTLEYALADVLTLFGATSHAIADHRPLLAAPALAGAAGTGASLEALIGGWTPAMRSMAGWGAR